MKVSIREAAALLPYMRTHSYVAPGSLLAIIFLYLMSGQELGTRDPLGTSIAWYIYAELALFGASLFAATVLWARSGNSFVPSRPFWMFLIFGLLASVCSIRSFWPLLSIVQACLFCAVLLLAECVCNTFSSGHLLRAIYYSIVAVFVVGLLAGAAMPGTYPLLALDDGGRHRLCIFKFASGDYAYMTGLGVFMGGLPIVRAQWYTQTFLAVLTVASGSRACTIALIVIWLLFRLVQVKDIRAFLGIIGAAGAVLSIGALADNAASSGLAVGVHHILESFYGSKLLTQSPFELSGRKELWMSAAGIFRQCAFVGFGFAGARDQFLDLASWAGMSHNALLELLVTAGGIGLLIFLAAWMAAVSPSFRSASGRSSLAIQCFILVSSVTGLSLTMFQYFGSFLLICLHYWTTHLPADESLSARRHARTTPVLSDRSRISL